MTTPKLTLAEQETIITFSAADTTANIYSTHQPWINKIKKLPGAKPYGIGWEVDVPKNWIKVTPPRKPTKAQLAHLDEIREKSLAARRKK